MFLRECSYNDWTEATTSKNQLIMNINEVSFDTLQKAVAHLMREVAEIKSLLEKIQTPVVSTKRHPIGIDDACKILGKAKPTVYALVRERKIPCYKNGKKLYFFENELISWIESGKKKTILEIEEEANVWIVRRKNR